MRENERNIHTEVDQVLQNGERYKEYPVRLGYFQAAFFLSSVVRIVDSLEGRPFGKMEDYHRNPFEDLASIFGNPYKAVGRESLLAGLEYKLGVAHNKTISENPDLSTPGVVIEVGNGEEYDITLNAREIEAITWAVLKRGGLADYMVFGVPTAARDQQWLVREGLDSLLNLFDQFSMAGGTFHPVFRQMTEAAAEFYSVDDYQI